MISQSACNATLSQAKSVSLKPPPGHGTRWVGIPFKEFLDTVQNKLRKAGYLELKKFSGHLWYDDYKLDGSFRVTHTDLGETGVFPCFGFSLSNLGDRRTVFYAGGVADGVPFVIDRWKVDYNATSGFNLSKSMEDAVGRFDNSALTLAKVSDRMRRTEVSPVKTEQIVLRTGRRGLLPWSKIGKFDSAVRENGDRSLWGLAAAFAGVVALTSPPQQMNHLYQFARMLASRNAEKERV